MLITHCPACHASLTVSQIGLNIGVTDTLAPWSEPDLPNSLAFLLGSISTRRDALRDALVDYCWSLPWDGHITSAELHGRFIEWANLRAASVSKTLLSSILLEVGGTFIKTAGGRGYYCPGQDVLPPRGRRFDPLQYVDRHGQPLPAGAASQPDGLQPGDAEANRTAGVDPGWAAVQRAAASTVLDPAAHASWCSGVGEHQPGASPCYRVVGAGDGASAQVPIDADAPPVSLPARPSFIDMTDGPDFGDPPAHADWCDDLGHDVVDGCTRAVPAPHPVQHVADIEPVHQVAAPAGADASIDYSVTPVPADAPGLAGGRYAMPLPAALVDAPFGELEAHFADHLPAEYLLAGPVAIRAQDGVDVLHAVVHRIDGLPVDAPAPFTEEVQPPTPGDPGTTTWLDGPAAPAEVAADPTPAPAAAVVAVPADDFQITAAQQVGDGLVVLEGTFTGSAAQRVQDGLVGGMSVVDDVPSGFYDEDGSWDLVTSAVAEKGAPGALPEWQLLVRGVGQPPKEVAQAMLDHYLPSHARRLGGVEVRPETVASSGMWLLRAAFTDRPLQPAAQPAPQQAWQPVVLEPAMEAGRQLRDEVADRRRAAAVASGLLPAPSTDVDDAGDTPPAPAPILCTEDGAAPSADDVQAVADVAQQIGDGILDETITPMGPGQLEVMWLLDDRWAVGTAPLDGDALVQQLLAGRDLGVVTSTAARRSTRKEGRRVRVSAHIEEHAQADVASPLIMAGQDDAGQPVADTPAAPAVSDPAPADMPAAPAVSDPAPADMPAAPAVSDPALADTPAADVVQPDVASGIISDPELEAQVDAARQAFLAGVDPVAAGDPSIDAGLAADAAADALAEAGRAPVPGGPADVLARRRAAAQQAAPVRSWVSADEALDAGDWG